MEDVIYEPRHYKSKKGLETIDVIEAFTEDLDGMKAVCQGHILRYICRWPKKNGLEDLKKAQFYLDHLIMLEEREACNKDEDEDDTKCPYDGDECTFVGPPYKSPNPITISACSPYRDPIKDPNLIYPISRSGCDE